MAWADVVFLLCAAVMVLSACAIVTRKNPVYSVICMLPFMLGMSLLFALLQAPFLAAMQLMVYGGAILVVFLFVIMLINLRPEELKDDFDIFGYFVPVLGVAILAGLVAACGMLDTNKGSRLDKGFASEVDGKFGSIADLSGPLFKTWVVPFELVSVLIVVAILGAVVLAKKKA